MVPLFFDVSARITFLNVAPFEYYICSLWSPPRKIDKKNQAPDVYGWTSVAVPGMARSDRCRLKARRKPSFLKKEGKIDDKRFC